MPHHGSVSPLDVRVEVMGKQSRRTRKQHMSEHDSPTSADGTEMPDWMVSEIMNIIVDKWRGTLVQYKEDDLRKMGLYDAVFCEHNEKIAARCVFDAHYVTFPASMTHEMVVAAAKSLLRNA